MEKMIQLPPIPSSILGIADIIVEKVEITISNEFLISVKSEKEEILCRKCGKETDVSTLFRTACYADFCIFSYSTGDK
jgi:hypothetical protein